jgi:hypothetical protein
VDACRACERHVLTHVHPVRRMGACQSLVHQCLKEASEYFFVCRRRRRRRSSSSSAPDVC